MLNLGETVGKVDTETLVVSRKHMKREQTSKRIHVPSVGIKKRIGR